MSAPNIPLTTIKEVRDKLNSKSRSFCVAKWLQVTIHLQNGQTHSCHHPRTHKIPPEELKADPSALHNTAKKKLIRKDMIEGTRPEECQYCWDIEDAHDENFSDRSIKSAQKWARPRIDEVKNLPWEASINPAYVEVSFGNECNFLCAYCAPQISSSIMNEVKKHGPYTALSGQSEESLRANGLYPFSKEEREIYVEAFWDWWPELLKDLKVFRITGGEPLLNANTFRFLEYLKTHPMPELTLAINSNLGVPKQVFEKFISEVKHITDHKLVKEFQLFTSVDTHGRNAEFLRFGLSYPDFMENVRTYLAEIQDSELIFMCAYNAFSVLSFRKFLEDVVELKSKNFDSTGSTRITLDIPYLKEPNFLSCYVLTPEFLGTIRSDVDYLKSRAFLPDGTEIVYQTEISKLERIANWVAGLEENQHRRNKRIELGLFVKEYCERKNIAVKDYIPEYLPFLEFCESSDKSK